MSQTPHYIQILSLELEKRKKKNPRYSMRAFANALDLDPSALSRILNARQELSISSCIKILKKLSLTEAEKNLFLTSIAEDRMYRAYHILSKYVGHSPSALSLQISPFSTHHHSLKEERLSFLLETGKLLEVTLDYRSILEKVARLPIPRIADICIIHILDECGRMIDLEVASQNPESEAKAREMVINIPNIDSSSYGHPCVLKTGKPQLIQQLDLELEKENYVNDEHFKCWISLDMKSVLCVPLKIHNRILGTLTLSSSQPTRIYTTEDLTFAEEFARHSAYVIYASFLHTHASNQPKR